MPHLQSILHPGGSEAARIAALWWGLLAICTIVWVAVAAAAAIGMLRGHRGQSAHVSDAQVGRRVAVAGAASVIALIAILFESVLTGRALNRIQTADALRITVTGNQWWWDVQYDNPNPSLRVTTANEIHIPVGRPVAFDLFSNDVIHSLWIPNLQGKIDLVPGRRNELWLQADKAGYYWGQCAEYCGLSHANMRLKVVVHSKAGFAKWQDAQIKSANVALDPSTPAGSGAELFRAKGCGGCHTINGYTAGQIGPNLTHFMSRKVFAGAIFPNNLDELRAWLRNPPKEKPMMPNNGMGMPNLNLAENEISDLIAFLQTLK